MKPILIIPPDTIDADGIKSLNDNGICTVVATDPSKVKFLDPIPAMAERTKVEDAAIRFSRKMLDRESFINSQTRNWKSLEMNEVARMFVTSLIEGTPLDACGTIAEQEQQIITDERECELRKIAREEARAESAQRKAEREAAKKPKMK